MEIKTFLQNTQVVVSILCDVSMLSFVLIWLVLNFIIFLRSCRAIKLLFCISEGVLLRYLKAAGYSMIDIQVNGSVIL